MKNTYRHAIQKASAFQTRDLGNNLNKIIKERETEKAERAETYTDGLITGVLVGILAGMILAGILVQIV